ncbi:uncharacterized protein C8A04DRAFT_36599 [Dichotomopilus funicola]|uniref:Uncharacterized protein n=1 Tax=Dichotomopilus funicola TaxID=1934379 RepID=A0AAN6ZN57_9PEZI|nr:hypothetical protein C8A04DRAFT_36599 [Dichotomopilus funicola]
MHPASANLAVQPFTTDQGAAFLFRLLNAQTISGQSARRVQHGTHARRVQRWTLSSSAATLLGVLSLLAPDNIPDADAPCCRVSDIMEELLSLGLIHRDAATNNLSIHRLVQSEFRYSSRNTLQQTLQDASQLLFHAFPKQVFGRSFRPQFPKCRTFIQHVYFLRDHTAAALNHQRSLGVSLRPSKDFCRLMCNAAYYLVETGAAKELARMVDVTRTAFHATGLITEEPLSYAHFCNSAGLEREMSGDFSSAKELLERAKDIRFRELPLGNLNLSSGKYPEALKYHLICKETVNYEVKANVRMNWNNLGRCYTGLGCYSEAMGAFEKAKGLILNKQPGFRNHYYWIGNMQMAQGNLEGAKAAYTKGWECLKDTGEIVSADMAVCMYKLGLIALRNHYGSRDKELPGQAIDYFRKAISMMEFWKVADCEVARASYMLSMALSHNGGNSEAAMWLERAEGVRKQMQGPEYVAEGHGEIVYDSLVESWVR